ncbi:uncharacterized protein LOC126897266 [Daktulosphaira vitifoliae]|uniref:uncharacterized protein LOC126897266 n=1 Tax=Daktulosphaira vitifoliae TaxID=58002 RepID=UPI0021A9868E|nr:uncharacterized protein LOC126897266 [Daktulosphaira vitifoliae]
MKAEISEKNHLEPPVINVISDNDLNNSDIDDQTEYLKPSLSGVFSSKISILSKTNPEKYILKNDKPATLAKHVERILTRLNKIEHNISTFMEKSTWQENANTSTNMVNLNVGTETENKMLSTLSETVKNMTKELDRYDIVIDSIRTELEHLDQRKIEQIDLENAFVGIPSLQEFDGKMSVFDFNSAMDEIDDKFLEMRKFGLDHSSKVKIELLDTIENINQNIGADFENIRKDFSSKIVVLQKQVKQLIEKDPEASGVAKFIKGVTCISCATPAMIRTTNNMSLCKFKNWPARVPNIRLYLASELDRLKKEQKLAPYSKNMNILAKYKNNNKKIKDNKSYMDGLVKLEQHIKRNKSFNKEDKHCNSKKTLPSSVIINYI